MPDPRCEPIYRSSPPSASLVAAVGVVFAFRLAGNLALPLKMLAKNAEKLAAGDVSVELGALTRKDEVGDIARAVEVFRGNVRAQMQAQIDADAHRRTANEDRVRHESARASAAGDQNLAMTSIADGLTRLAKGDLTCKIVSIPDAYRQIAMDFNAALDQLREAMQSIARSSEAMNRGSGEVSVAANDLSSRTERTG